MENLSQFQLPRTILSGPGSSQQFGHELTKLGIRKPLIVTDPGIVQAGILGRVVSGLEKTSLTVNVYDEVAADPPIHVVEAAANTFQRTESDAFIGLGGGSSIDAAKAAAVIAVNEGNPIDYRAPFEEFPSTPPPLIAIPTTAGTGSEVGSAAVITDLERKEKFVIKSVSLSACLTVLDPELLAGLPVQVAAQTSLDALSHIIESFVSRRKTPLTESIALEAARRWAENLRPYLEDRSDLTAANHMIHASCMAGMSMSNAGLGLVHALAHPFGALTHIPHGAVCAIFMPPVIRYNESEVGDQYAHLGKILAPAFWPTGDAPEHLTATTLADGIATLADQAGIPRRLSEIERSAVLSEKTLETILNAIQCQTNPRPVDRESVQKIWQDVQ